jgi:hypothetical protein
MTWFFPCDPPMISYLIMITNGPRQISCWTFVIIIVIAVLYPLIHIANHIVESEYIRLKRSNWRGPPSNLATATSAIGISLADLVTPVVGRRAASASRIFPFRFSQQTVGAAGHFGEPRHIPLSVIPADIDDWSCASSKSTVGNVGHPPTEMQASQSANVTSSLDTAKRFEIVTECCGF